jgi:ferric-dicitrate binding protein FerR (iron transport regulator)
MLPDEVHAFLERFAGDAYTEEEHARFIKWLWAAGPEEAADAADRYRDMVEKKIGSQTKNIALASAIEAALDRMEGKVGEEPGAERVKWAGDERLDGGGSGVLERYGNERSEGTGNETAKQEYWWRRRFVLAAASLLFVVGMTGWWYSVRWGGREAAEKEKIVYNTVRVPRRATYHILLPDGTNVWLNAASTLRWPTVFSGNERLVDLTGEAYFNVAVNAGMPFHIRHRLLDVEVLGTVVNVNAYEDEKEAKVTLLQGAVRVSQDSSAALGVVLKPGQQARATAAGQLVVENNADLEAAVAWTAGRFRFDHADVKSILRQLTRWYDIEVSYQGDIGERYFTGEFSRSKSLSDIVKLLELNHIHCKIEGHYLIVKPPAGKQGL